jgi:cytoskeletal protein RodZ
MNKLLWVLNAFLWTCVIIAWTMFFTAPTEGEKENEQSTFSTTQQSEVSSTTEETQTTTTDTTYQNESTTQETVEAPVYTPANTEEYTAGSYMGYDPNLQGESYQITRNSDGMKGVITIDSQANMQWYYYDAEGIHTNGRG